MQPTTLLDNLNSDFLAAMSILQPKSAAERVLVYVESDDDISFWRYILNPFEGKKINFDIQLPISDELKKGKVAVLGLARNVGKNLILCVDSDYDYLLQNETKQSKKVHMVRFYIYS